MGKSIMIRTATISDATRLREIYAYYVENTAVSFEYVTPSPQEFRVRIQTTLQKYPYLVLEDNGAVLGYAYAGAFHPRAAFARCCELSIYLDKDARKMGYGRMLYEALEKELEAMGMLNLYACIASPIKEDEYLTHNSELFHSHLGYKKVAQFHRCGYKFGRWYNAIWMEKLIKP